MSARLTATLASRYARVALANLVAEYPNKLDHLMHFASDAQTPRALHPAFYGSYDWHSAVHMHWLLVALIARFPNLPEAAAIRARMDEHLTDANIAAECAYLARPGAASFERTYGWAWLLKLSAELHDASDDDADAARRRNALAPLTDAFVARYLAFMPKADYAIRAGTHSNSAFGLLLALDYSEAASHVQLGACIAAKATTWYGSDVRYPARLEPGGDDFLSGGLVEAALMRRVFASERESALRSTHGEERGEKRFSDWWAAFTPDETGLRQWLTPVRVSDRRDAKLAHLDGLNLSRAWCWSLLFDALPDALQERVPTAIADHLAASLPHVVDGDYVGTHWLASVALLALLESTDAQR